MGKHLLAECDKGVSRDVLEMPPAWHVTLAPSARDAPDLSLEEWENNVKGLCVKFMEGTRVRSVTRTDAGTVLILTQPVIADPERTGANKPILESRPVCGDFTYLVLKPILACKEQPKLIFADLFKLWRHQPILWHCCEDKAYAIFLGPVKDILDLGVVTIKKKKAKTKIDFAIQHADEFACWKCAEEGDEPIRSEDGSVGAGPRMQWYTLS